MFGVYCSSALFQNQNCSNKIHKGSSDHMPHVPGLQKPPSAEITMEPHNAPSIANRKNHGETKSALLTNEHFRLFQVLFVEVTYAG